MKSQTEKACRVMLTLLLIMPWCASAQNEKIQAIFLYKFIDNVNWPDSKRNLRIGIIGNTEVLEEFQKILKVRSTANLTAQKISVSEVATCDVIYIPQSHSSNFNKVIEYAKSKSILIVTEEADFVKKGAGISFLQEEDKLGFIVNKHALDVKGLKVSTLLLTLGKEI
jgi:hypothetical protein